MLFRPALASEGRSLPAQGVAPGVRAVYAVGLSAVCPSPCPSAMAQAKPKKKRAPRTRTVPLPPQALELKRELRILDSLDGRTRLALWRALRRVRLWVETPEDRREGLFLPAAEGVLRESVRACEEEPALLEPLGALSLLRRGPHRMEEWQVAEACRLVWEWADRRGLLSVGVLFAEAAALAEPESPGRSNDAARLCRRAALHDRAEVWYTRAMVLAGQASTREGRKEGLWALLGFGTLMRETGRHEAARTHFNKAARKADSLGMKREAAEVHHDLLLLCAEMGEFPAAAWHARSALNLYPLSHPRFPALAHDFAFLLVRQCYFTPALSLLEKTIHFIEAPAERAVVWSTLARAAAGAGRRDRFEQVEREILHLIGIHEEFAPAALIHLAEGKRAFGEWDSAGEYAEKTLEAAERRKTVLLERDATELLERIASREPAPEEEVPSKRERLTVLIPEFVRRLGKWEALGRYRSRAGPEGD